MSDRAPKDVPAFELVNRWTETARAQALTVTHRYLALKLAARCYVHAFMLRVSNATLGRGLGVHPRTIRRLLDDITQEEGGTADVPFYRERGGANAGGTRTVGAYWLNLKVLYALVAAPAGVARPGAPMSPVAGARTGDIQRTDRGQMAHRPGTPVSHEELTPRTNGKNYGTAARSRDVPNDNGNDAPTATAGRTTATGRPKGYRTAERISNPGDAARQFTPQELAAAVKANEARRVAAANDVAAFVRALPEHVRMLVSCDEDGVREWIDRNRRSMPEDGEALVWQAIADARDGRSPGAVA